jgi:hypothetical protein
MTVSIATIIAKALTAFLGLPVVCASPNFASVFISDLECAPTFVEICEPGTFFAGSQVRVCCPDDSESFCRIGSLSNGCVETEYHVCDRPPTLPMPSACAAPDGASAYISEDGCSPREWDVCEVGHFNPGASWGVCCSFDGDMCTVIAGELLCPNPTDTRMCDSEY